MGSSEAVPPTLNRLAAWSWRLLVIGGAIVAGIWVIGQLWLVLLPIAVSLLLARVLIAPTNWLRRRRWPPALATATVLFGFFIALAAIGVTIGVAVVDESQDLGDNISTAIDDLEDWLVDDAPFDVSQSDLETFREGAGDAFQGFISSPGGGLLGGATLAAQLLASIFVGIIASFFVLKDGSRFAEWIVELLPEQHRDLASRLGDRAWTALGGFLRGAALLGVVEGVVIGGAMMIVGAELAIPVAVITFFGAFVPFLGALVAGVIAVLVTLATAGLGPAIAVAVVAVLVQQFDNDLLAPVIYGHALSLHPVTILFGVVAGGALFGLGGSFAAVPVLAVVTSSIAELRKSTDDRDAVESGTDPPMDDEVDGRSAGC